MKNHPVTVFFFVNNNHISNVKTLQSIYKQDYSNINLLICNDCIYGFESERFLYNFQEYKNENISQIYFHENFHPLGEYESVLQFRGRLKGEFLIIIHSGEYFLSSSILRESIAAMEYDSSIAAEIFNAEYWDDSFTKRIAVETALINSSARQLLHADDIMINKLRDCMVIYRLSVLNTINLKAVPLNLCTSQCVIPQIMENGAVISIPASLCRFSLDSTQNRPKKAPESLGNVRLKNIEKILEQNKTKEIPPNSIFEPSVLKPPIYNIHKLPLTLYKFSTYIRVKNYAVISLLLFIAAALFFNLSNPLSFLLGTFFIVLASVASLWTIGMAGCNLYFKKNPQRLVNTDEK